MFGRKCFSVKILAITVMLFPCLTSLLLFFYSHLGGFLIFAAMAATEAGGGGGGFLSNIYRY